MARKRKTTSRGSAARNRKSTIARMRRATSRGATKRTKSKRSNTRRAPANTIRLELIGAEAGTVARPADRYTAFTRAGRARL